MVGRKRQSQKARRLLGNHQKSWIWGRNLVTETLCTAAWRPVQLVLSADLPTAEQAQARSAAVALGATVEVVEPARVRQLCGAADHQGFAARMPAFPYATPDLLRTLAQTGATSPLFVVCDCVQDPFNFGAILRSARGLNADAVVIPQDGQVGVTSQVARSSAGAVNHVPIVRVADLVVTCRELREFGLQVVACAGESPVPVWNQDFRGPVAVVVGNEGQGIDPRVLSQASATVAIPLHADVESLNAAAATAVVLYEVVRQRSAS